MSYDRYLHPLPSSNAPLFNEIFISIFFLFAYCIIKIKERGYFVEENKF